MSFSAARRKMAEMFNEDAGLKQSYVANIAMFLRDTRAVSFNEAKAANDAAESLMKLIFGLNDAVEMDITVADAVRAVNENPPAKDSLASARAIIERKFGTQRTDRLFSKPLREILEDFTLDDLVDVEKAKERLE